MALPPLAEPAEIDRDQLPGAAALRHDARDHVLERIESLAIATDERLFEPFALDHDMEVIGTLLHPSPALEADLVEDSGGNFARQLEGVSGAAAQSHPGQARIHPRGVASRIENLHGHLLFRPSG
jgi:hypothetical protein